MPIPPLMESVPTSVNLARVRHKGRWLVALGLACFLLTGGVLAAVSGGHHGLPLIVTACAFLSCIAPYAAFVATSFARDLRILLRKYPLRIWMLPAFFVIVYIAYGIGTSSLAWNAALRLTLFVGIPTGLTYAARHAQRVTWLDAVAVAMIWIPFDFGWLASIWSWPAGEGAYVINTAMAVVLASVLFGSLRKFEHVSIRFSLNAREACIVGGCLAGFLLLAVPFGFGTGFIDWNPKPLDLRTLVGTPLGILFFIAIPEELLFRGLVQNMLQSVLKSNGKALVVASLFFGLTHLNNEPLMDWRYTTLATGAGFFYGTAYEKSRSLLVPALVHALVDTLWVLLFLKP